MKFAIIAAGEGSRLKAEGVQEDKPLVRLNGEPMLRRLVRIFTDVGASEIVMIVNASMPEVEKLAFCLKAEHKLQGKCPLHVLVKSTPSSMHSFYEMSDLLEGEPFCLTTVDTVFREEDFRKYVQEFRNFQGDGLMVVTSWVDDEKPLYVQTDENLQITGFYDEQHRCKYVSGGIYGLKPVALDVLRKCVAEGKSRMRNFQRQLVSEGLTLKAYEMPRVLDVDHAEDILKSEKFLLG